MFDAETEVEARLIGERQLAPQLFIARGRSHARFVPDVREVREFHR